MIFHIFCCYIFSSSEIYMVKIMVYVKNGPEKAKTQASKVPGTALALQTEHPRNPMPKPNFHPFPSSHLTKLVLKFIPQLPSPHPNTQKKKI